MGIFDFLKKKKHIEEEIVKFSQVDDWIKRKLERQGMPTRVKSFKEEMDTKTMVVKELLSKLEEASLMNENIPERVKQIMKGNRVYYITKVTRFLEEINIPEDYLRINDFSLELSERMDQLTKETQKSYFVLREFLEREVSVVIKKIREMEDLAIEFQQKLKNKKLDKLEELKEKLAEYDSSKNKLKGLEELKNKKQTELEELKNKEKSIIEKISGMKNGTSFKAYELLKKDEQTVAEDILKQKKEIISHFANLEKAFKKYARIALDPTIIDKYLADCVNALLDDKELKISESLGKMLQSISQLELKDKKEEKTKEEINKLNPQFLKQLREQLELLVEDEKKIKHKLLLNTSAMNISEQESWLENTRHKTEDKEKEIETVDNQIERINPKLIKQDVRDILKEFMVVMEN